MSVCLDVDGLVCVWMWMGECMFGCGWVNERLDVAHINEGNPNSIASRKYNMIPKGDRSL